MKRFMLVIALVIAVAGGCLLSACADLGGTSTGLPACVVNVSANPFGISRGDHVLSVYYGVLGTDRYDYAEDSFSNPAVGPSGVKAHPVSIMERNGVVNAIQQDDGPGAWIVKRLDATVVNGCDVVPELPTGVKQVTMTVSSYSEGTAGYTVTGSLKGGGMVTDYLIGTDYMSASALYDWLNGQTLPIQSVSFFVHQEGGALGNVLAVIVPPTPA